ncbi:MAG: 1,4-dihydroxy-2-naphthoate octaprenyltransferase [Chloroflexi bacterium]|nr:1,4-dihydroxy-2-naphthoate octaprenyltransferase [Chloroflexota bacterium]
MARHSRDEVLTLLKGAEVGAVATLAGDTLRTRMMHFAVADDFTVYVASMKGDPKTVQMTHHPSVSILVHRPSADINQSSEVELTGKALLVRDAAERERALALTAVKSPVVAYMVSSGNAGMLDCVKIAPDTIKYRIFGEIAQGAPPTVLEFPKNRFAVSDWYLARMKLKNWGFALRWSFCTASALAILLGTAMGWLAAGNIHWGYFALTLLGGLCLQLGTNVINDYFDHKSGNDEVNREFVRPFSGGSRVIQSGLLSPLEVLLGALLFLVVGSAIGFYLAWARGPWILVLGAMGLLGGVFYVGGPFKWANRGLGELMVFINYGLLMTLGAYYVQTQSLAWQPLVGALPLALLITAVLYINELPDYAADKQVGKDTLVVRLGRAGSVAPYVLMMVGVYVSLLGGVALGVLPLSAVIGLATLPLTVRAVLYARRHHSSSFDLVPANALTVVTHLGTGLLLVLAYVWQGLGLAGIGFVAGLGVIFLGFTAYMYWHVERQKNIFLGLRKAMR